MRGSEQHIWHEKVLRRLRDRFVTESGLVIEGNYEAGELAPIIFDRRYRTFIPVYKERKDAAAKKIDTKFLENVRRRTTGKCTITLIDPPLIVQPMRYPGEIHEGETQGIDYIKTYYGYNITECSTCRDELGWEFSSLFKGAGQQEPTDHCLYSLDGGCWGEKIGEGEDEEGKYILWKVYTESSNYSRTGLGVILVKATIKNNKNEVMCKASGEVVADCCQKAGDQRNVVLYWEGLGECSPFIYYGDKVLCEVPGLISLLELQNWAWAQGNYFYAVPDVRGGCIPFEWILNGPGSLEPDDAFGATALYKNPEDPTPHCNDVTITVRDRCGTVDTVVASCCQTAASLEMGYTSLVMSCGGSQTLSATGGCGPYQWSLSGGGTLMPSENTTSAIYTAPETNPNCTLNPTITLTDCCGNEASIQIAVNCYTADVTAYRIYEWVEIGPNVGCNFPGASRWYLYRADYRCDGSLKSYELAIVYGLFTGAVCMCGNNDPTSGGPLCHPTGCPPPTCTTLGCTGPCYNGCPTYTYCCVCSRIITWGCDGMHDYPAGGVPYECRTQEMKDEGCCPINPYTGLPF